jgi:DNA ligase-1
MLKGVDEHEQKRVVLEAWNSLSPPERFVFNKLITGAFRVGVSRSLVIRALSEATGLEKSLLAHRLMGNRDPAETSYADILHPADDDSLTLSRPYPFLLASPFDKSPHELGNPADWLIEWKWDGIRAQAIFRSQQFFLWSRGEDLLTEQFPELQQLQHSIPDGTVLDGEILPYHAGQPLGFHLLQTRLGRKTVTPRLMREAPIIFVAYDLLESNGVDIRSKPLHERRELLENLLKRRPPRPGPPLLLLSEKLSMTNWSELNQKREIARDRFTEGLMIKDLQSTYLPGRIKGTWWKWKIDPLTIDAVLIQAQPGHGRRASLFTDYTFAVWKGDELTPFAKAYSGLTDEEIRQVDTFIKRNTRTKHGPVRTVEPDLVFEIGFENVALSKRHRSGVAVRFPRILRWRRDKPAKEADTLATLQALVKTPPAFLSGRVQLELF